MVNILRDTFDHYQEWWSLNLADACPCWTFDCTQNIGIWKTYQKSLLSPSHFEFMARPHHKAIIQLLQYCHNCNSDNSLTGEYFFYTVIWQLCDNCEALWHSFTMKLSHSCHKAITVVTNLSNDGNNYNSCETTVVWWLCEGVYCQEILKVAGRWQVFWQVFHIPIFCMWS